MIPLVNAEPVPIPIDCNFHTWMRSYLVVLDHPYLAISDQKGNLAIEGLPENETVQFRVLREASVGSIKQVMIKGETVDWAQGRFSVDLANGVNDLREIVIPASTLIPN